MIIKVFKNLYNNKKSIDKPISNKLYLIRNNCENKNNIL